MKFMKERKKMPGFINFNGLQHRSYAVKRALIKFVAFGAASFLGVNSVSAGSLYLPNGSFESPPAPSESPYASPELAVWQKSPQPSWYDPAQNENTPWDYLVGSFFNVPFPGQFIENCDGRQATFIFAVPEVGVSQEAAPGSAFDAVFNPGRSYRFAAHVIGGGGGMKVGATLELRLFYRDATSNKVTIASTSITNGASLFPTNTQFVPFSVVTPAVKSTDAWARRNIGIEIVSTVGFDRPGGYWDVDNVRLTEEIEIPNGSFESPIVPPVSPYATPEMTAWSKTPQPAWYDPSQNDDTPWAFLTGTFFNVPFPGQFIENADGNQACFLFALPEAGILIDYESVSGTNGLPDHVFEAQFTPGKGYRLTAGFVGGGGGMQPGASIELALYYRDGSNLVTVASTNVVYSREVFPTNTYLVDYSAILPDVRETDPWAGRPIGVRIVSTTPIQLASGYWDVDHVRLVESTAPRLAGAQGKEAQLEFTLLSEPGAVFDLQRTAQLGAAVSWQTAGAITNVTGLMVITEPFSDAGHGFYRVRQQ